MNQELSHIPLVAVTGDSTEKDRELAVGAGFDLVFPKPVKFADLSTALDAYGNGTTHR
ncbi:MAG TPA: hypothetical protein VEB70_09975 [Noviherbaspirillum sp.]|nr:hypothetical protein [Noviherbaspirillum sp.]